MLDRRTFLACTASNLLVHSAARADALAPVTIILDDDGPGRPIAPDFMGLSYESALLAAPDYFSPDNRSLIALLRALGDRGVLRLGGNSSERTVWSTDAASDGAARYAITPEAIDRFARFLDRLGWRAIYGLNLADNIPERAAEEAEYVTNALGPRLLAIQIGNEPDGFGRWSRVRPASYDVRSFLDDWQRFHAAIQARVPEARFAGPDVAAKTAWIAPFADARPAHLVLLTRHYYAAGPASDPSVTLAKLLHSQAQLAGVLSELRELSNEYRLPFRIAETNSVYAGGRPGVSDTMGAALWGLELMFQVASAGGSGVNFHAGPDKVYTPVGEPGPPHRPQPLYYGLLLFARTAAGEIIPSRIEGPAEITPFATRASDGTVRVCLVNKSSAAMRVRIVSPRRFAAAAERLSASSLDARSGLTLADAAVDSHGAPSSRADHLDPDEAAIQLDLAPASAALVRMEPQ